MLLSYGGSCLIAAVWAGCTLRRVWHAAPPAAVPLPRTVLWARVAPFAAWVLLGSVLINLFEVVDRYMIIHFLADVGDRGPRRGGQLPQFPRRAHAAGLHRRHAGAMITPHLSHDWEAGRREQVVARLRLFLKLFGFALSAGAVAVLLAAPLLFELAFRNKFPGGQAVLPWTLVYCTWFGLSLVLQNYLFCARRPGWPAWRSPADWC